MTKTLPVSAIENGTVIDHIRAGQAPRIMQLLDILKSKQKITMGCHLPSQLLGLKDLIKIENRRLTPNEANEVVVFAPEATINIIENFEVIEKVTTHLPEKLEDIFVCANPMCITHQEPISSIFHIDPQGKQIKLICHYCEKSFDQDQVKVKI